MRTEWRYETLVRRIFALGLWVKGFDGILEIIGGILLLVISPATLNRLVQAMTQHELVEDPRDLIATTLRAVAAQLNGSTSLFASLYLIAHGLVKVGLVVGLLRGVRWVYPAAMGFLSFFIAYQLYRLSYQFSWGLLLLTIFDMGIVALTWHDYQGHRS